MRAKRLPIAIAVLAWPLLAAGCQAPLFSGSAYSKNADATTDDDLTLIDKLAGKEKLERPDEKPRETVSEHLGKAGAVSAAATSPPAGNSMGVPAPSGAPAPPSGVSADDVALQNLGSSLNGVKADKLPKDDDESSGFDWEAFDPQNIYKSIRNSLGYGPNEPLAQQYYQEGLKLRGQKSYAAAADQFERAADRWPDSVLEEDSLFYCAESYFFADLYPKSHDTFLALFKKYPNSRYLDASAKCEFAIAQYWEKTYREHPHWPMTPNMSDKSTTIFDLFGNAMAAYMAVRINDPTGPLADSALMAMGNAYFVQGQYEDAAYNYDLLRKEYPHSKFQLQAHLLGLQAKRLMYQGPLYDSSTLNDADDIAQQTLKQFHGQLGDEQARIVQARHEIREQRAERELAAGWFYERKEAYGAARMYYQGVIKNFPGTQCALWATNRLEQIKSYPDTPYQPLKEFGKLFDSRRD